MSGAEPVALTARMSTAVARSRSALRANVRNTPRGAAPLIAAAGLGSAAIVPLFLGQGSTALVADRLRSAEI